MGGSGKFGKFRRSLWPFDRSLSVVVLCIEVVVVVGLGRVEKLKEISRAKDEGGGGKVGVSASVVVLCIVVVVLAVLVDLIVAVG